jgi:hypothetical protein
VTAVGHVRLFTAGLRNLNKDVENWKKMTSGWQVGIARDAALSQVEAKI